jgi:hypothetical protein
MKWIVFWIAISVYPAPCPIPEIITNEYGITSGGIYSTNLMACYKTDRKNMQKEFDSLEAALVFVEKGKKEYPERVLMGDSCEGWEIKELKPIGGTK